jgi:hypothetical protein
VDRKPVLVLRFDVESAFALRRHPPTAGHWRAWIDETFAAVASICKVLNRHAVPATFFVTGLVLEHAGAEIAGLLKGNPAFDVQSHSYSHQMGMDATDSASLAEFRDELARTERLLSDTFGVRPIGFCAPGNFYRGLRGKPRPLAVLWERGYRFVGSDGQDARGLPYPAPFTQPYWYDEEGFSDLLELPITGWHCNMLFNSGHQNDGWTSAPGFPDGSILERLPETVGDGFQARAKEFLYAIERGLIYAPAMHPWSIYRFDPQLEHLDRLIQLAEDNEVRIMNCLRLYELYVRQKSRHEAGGGAPESLPQC